MARQMEYPEGPDGIALGEESRGMRHGFPEEVHIGGVPRGGKVPPVNLPGLRSQPFRLIPVNGYFKGMLPAIGGGQIRQGRDMVKMAVG